MVFLGQNCCCIVSRHWWVCKLCAGICPWRRIYRALCQQYPVSWDAFSTTSDHTVRCVHNLKTLGESEKMLVKGLKQEELRGTAPTPSTGLNKKWCRQELLICTVWNHLQCLLAGYCFAVVLFLSGMGFFRRSADFRRFRGPTGHF